MPGEGPQALSDPANAGGVSASTALRRGLGPLGVGARVVACLPRLHVLLRRAPEAGNPNFFNANSPSSIQAQLIASIPISSLDKLLGHLLRFAVPIGIVIALAELAVGLERILGR